MMQHEGRKFQFSGAVFVRCRGSLPDLDAPPQANGEMSAGGGEGKSGDGIPEGKAVESNAPVEMREDSVPVVADGEEQVATRGKGKVGDRTTVGERQGMRFVARVMSNAW